MYQSNDLWIMYISLSSIEMEVKIDTKSKNEYNFSKYKIINSMMDGM